MSENGNPEQIFERPYNKNCMEYEFPLSQVFVLASVQQTQSFMKIRGQSPEEISEMGLI